jgi:PAS domain S-box-containing protein
MALISTPNESQTGEVPCANPACLSLTRQLEATRHELKDLELLINRGPAVVFLWRIADGWPVDYVTDNVRQFGYTPEDFLTGRVSWPGITHPDDVPRLEVEVAEHRRKGSTSFKQRYRLNTHDGRTCWIDDLTIAIHDASGTLTHFQGIILDVTDRKATEDNLLIYQGQLRSLAAQLAVAEERERRAIALSLHDNLGQSLALCKMKLDEVQSVISDAQAAQGLARVRDLIEESIHHTRLLTLELSPPVLYELGIGAAIDWLADDVLERHGLPVRAIGTKRFYSLDEATRTLLFRSVREILINVVKHAKAHRAQITLRSDRDTFTVTVQDNGVGFDPAVVSDRSAMKTGFGLFSIRERLLLSGGKMEISSGPGQGTRLSLAVPLAKGARRSHRSQGEKLKPCVP